MTKLPLCRGMQVDPPKHIPEPLPGEAYWDWRCRVGYWPAPQEYEAPAVYAPRIIFDPNKD